MVELPLSPVCKPTLNTTFALAPPVDECREDRGRPGDVGSEAAAAADGLHSAHEAQGRPVPIIRY